MIRIIVETDDAAMAVNVGGSVLKTLKTFDVELPELEAYLKQFDGSGRNYIHRQVIGVEAL